MNRFVIADPQLCIGCGTCMAACSTAHKAEGLQTHPRLTVMRHKQATAPVLCRHCEDAPCAQVCPVNAITQEQGSVVVNESLCVGCTLCAIACPFGAIAIDGSRPVDMANSYDTYIPSSVHSSNPSTSSPQCFGKDILAWEPGVKSIAVKCDLCQSTTGSPACIEVCPTKALFLVEEQGMADASQSKRNEAALDVSTIALERQES
ncbi:4Fe-4S dicluster domain-containing protein [Photobacterium sanguinicancri]|uniref:4Fe-4S dicluster domain-containing protein n=1 Tax=Photobacterium sanguinicancri TaxID=875932 RepID=UPI002480AAF2|nr:4Fe-4S dicluster domain-containing protein [Photobacterium sanguinicancri]